MHIAAHIGLLNHTPGDSERAAFRAVGDFEDFWSLASYARTSFFLYASKEEWSVRQLHYTISLLA